jgi:hypothetical protein
MTWRQITKAMSGMDTTIATANVRHDYRREILDGTMNQIEFEQAILLEALALKAQQVDACWAQQ